MLAQALVRMATLPSQPAAWPRLLSDPACLAPAADGDQHGPWAGKLPPGLTGLDRRATGPPPFRSSARPASRSLGVRSCREKLLQLLSSPQEKAQEPGKLVGTKENPETWN